MSPDSQTLVAAVEAGTLTDPGAMTTTQDIVHAVDGSYSAVHKQLHILADEDIIESKTFGKQEVWVVPSDSGHSPVRTPLVTNTRDPHAGN